jgi:hypothetical protein
MAHRIYIYAENGFMNATHLCDLINVDLMLYIKGESFKSMSKIIHTNFVTKNNSSIMEITKDETANKWEQGLYMHQWHIDQLVGSCLNMDLRAFLYESILSKINFELIHEVYTLKQRNKQLEDEIKDTEIENKLLMDNQ